MEEKTLYIILIVLVALTSILPTITTFVNRRRQQKELAEQFEKRQRYLEAIQAGDEVILFSGLHGKIKAIKDNVVELQIAQDVHVYVEKESIMGKAKELLFKK